ncbi:hydrolase [Bacillus sp. CRN 9]|uniref:hydrolase n=1 Tax=Cytobacillus horneckiae TaxID=549687 RepID=UPI001562350D|nr:hydrolase [Bacillus sp. CRN 9]
MMESTQNAYYIDIENGTILDTADGHDWQFKVYANGEQIAELNRYMRQNYDADLKTYVRAHVPFMEYHKKSQNPEYDYTMVKLYEMIYKFGDEESRQHINKMGIIDTNKMDKETE